jgi:hypothetical protein
MNFATMADGNVTLEATMLQLVVALQLKALQKQFFFLLLFACLLSPQCSPSFLKCQRL